jgi:hypothetical protein
MNSGFIRVLPGGVAWPCQPHEAAAVQIGLPEVTKTKGALCGRRFHLANRALEIGSSTSSASFGWSQKACAQRSVSISTGGQLKEARVARGEIIPATEQEAWSLTKRLPAASDVALCLAGEIRPPLCGGPRTP